MNGAARRAGVLLALVLLLLGARAAWAERHALLVGVSTYSSLGPELQLSGPAHDVLGLRDALRQRGFAAARMQVLADGVPGADGLPTRAAILGALDDLARRVQPGDTVVVQMAGHGSQEPVGRHAAPDEPDHWRETFLPRDVGRWNGQRGRVDGAITDRELQVALDRVVEGGAFVFAIFDACHSGTLVRGDPARGARTRQVAAADLGVPGLPPAPALLRTRSGEGGWRPPAGPASSRTAYFYAAQSGESIKSVRLPAGQPGAPERGLLSHSIAVALREGRPMTYRRLAEYVLSQYGSHRASATPLFSGDGLDTPVLGDAAPAFRQWPLETTSGALRLRAGSLDGLGTGALFSIVEGPLAGAVPPRADGTAGVLRARRVDAAWSELEPIAWGGRAATAVGAPLAGRWARLEGNPPALALRVAPDRTACRDGCLAGAVLAELERAGMPGVDLRWVRAGDEADVVLQATRDGLRYAIEARTDPAPLGSSWPAGTAVADAVRQVAADLHALARQRNLLNLAGQLALRRDEPPLTTTLRVHPADPRSPVRTVGVEQVPRLAAGDRLELSIHNAGPVAVDLTLLLLDADQGVSVHHPYHPGESNRLEPKATLVIPDMTISKRTIGTERLLLVWVEMARHRERRDFSALAQPPLQRVRGEAAGDPALQALFDACFADQVMRGEPPAPPPPTLGMRVHTLSVLP